MTHVLTCLRICLRTMFSFSFIFNQVTTIDVNENPLANVGEIREINENVGVGTLVGEAIAASDPDLSTLPHGTLSWSVEKVYGADMDYPIETLKNRFKEVSDTIFTIGGDNGQIYVGTPVLNREGDVNIYMVDVRIRDQGTPALDILSQVTIQILDVNERPVIKDQKRSIRENSPIDSTAGAPLIATDVDLDQELDFTIQDNKLFKVEGCSGKISVKEHRHKVTGAFLMNFEDAINSYEYTITVTDNGRLPDALSASAQIFIQLTNIPESPIVERAEISVVRALFFFFFFFFFFF